MADNPAKIDVHQHVLPPVYVETLAERGIHGAGGVKFPKWSAQSALDMMDGQNIRTGILSVSAPGVHFGDDRSAVDLARSCNTFNAELVQQHPERFGAFAVLPLPFVDGALREVEHALDVLKLDGVVLMSSHEDGSYLGDPRFDDVMDALNRRDAVVFVHPVVPVSAPGDALDIPPFATEFVFDTSRAIINLIWQGVAARCPRIRFIFSHAGGTAPYLAGRWALLDGMPQMRENAPEGVLHYLKRFYYDTALSGSAPALAALTRLVPSSQILFGSDFPFAPPPVSIAAWGGVSAFDGFDSNDCVRIASASAKQLFPGR